MHRVKGGQRNAFKCKMTVGKWAI